MFLLVSRYLVPKGYSGITVFPFVIIRERTLGRDEVLLNHEKIHIRQQAELLIAFFFIWYVTEYVFRWIKYRNRYQAYRNISFEREAYSNEKDRNYLKLRPFLKFLKYV
jgi:hypothetical protein